MINNYIISYYHTRLDLPTKPYVIDYSAYTIDMKGHTECKYI